jgi:hypothetical protein
MLDTSDPNWPLWRRAQDFNPDDEEEYNALKSMMPEPPQSPYSDVDNSSESDTQPCVRNEALDKIMRTLLDEAPMQYTTATNTGGNDAAQPIQGVLEVDEAGKAESAHSAPDKCSTKKEKEETTSVAN